MNSLVTALFQWAGAKSRRRVGVKRRLRPIATFSRIREPDHNTLPVPVGECRAREGPHHDRTCEARTELAQARYYGPCGWRGYHDRNRPLVRTQPGWCCSAHSAQRSPNEPRGVALRDRAQETSRAKAENSTLGRGAETSRPLSSTRPIMGSS